MDGRRRRLHNGRISRKQCGRKDDLAYVWRLRKHGTKWSFFYGRGRGGELLFGALSKEPTQ